MPRQTCRPGAVVVDVFLELITLGQDLTDGGRTEGHDRSGLIGRGLVAFADLGHPSSSVSRTCRPRPYPPVATDLQVIPAPRHPSGAARLGRFRRSEQRIYLFSELSTGFPHDSPAEFAADHPDRPG